MTTDELKEYNDFVGKNIIRNNFLPILQKLTIDNAVKYEDLMYFQNKLNNTTDPIKREKIQKQIDLLEDALIVYRLHSEIREIK